jgi:hypothetical protein
VLVKQELLLGSCSWTHATRHCSPPCNEREVDSWIYNLFLKYYDSGLFVGFFKLWLLRFISFLSECMLSTRSHDFIFLHVESRASLLLISTSSVKSGALNKSFPWVQAGTSNSQVEMKQSPKGEPGKSEVYAISNCKIHMCRNRSAFYALTFLPFAALSLS